MTAAEDLRADIAHAEFVWEDGGQRILWPDAPIFTAARTIALPILEADSELVERLMAVLPRDPYNKDQDRSKRILAEKILAAISTPTPVENS